MKKLWLNNQFKKLFVGNVGKYIRELSIVVVGVAITLSIGVWINHANNKKDINLYLDAIKLELEENISLIEEIIEYWQPSMNYANYLMSNNKEALNRDSIRSFSSAFYENRYDNFSTIAFEMFKISGLMRLMDDKQLIFSICNAYKYLNLLEYHLDECRKFKNNEMIKDMEDSSKWEIPMYNFFALSGTPKSIEGISKWTSKMVKITISDLERGATLQQTK
jgi:hypothetical protein